MRLDELARRIGATLEGDGGREIARCAPIQSAGADAITFIANSRYHKYLHTTEAAAVLVDHKTQTPNGLTRLVCDDPYLAFRNALVELTGFRSHPEPMGCGDRDQCGVACSGHSDDARIHESATVDASACIHPNVVIEQGAVVGAGTVLYPGVYIGCDARVGADCVLYPNAVVYDRCVIGDRVMIHANSSIGNDGFGYATSAGVHHKIPQTGNVVIEDDVEIGACCSIERAAMGETRIGAGTKFADLISIGHGTTIGRGCLLVSLVGVSGSVEMGNYVVLGGHSAVVGHLSIGDGVQAAGKSAIANDIPAGQKVGGTPAMEWDKAKRNVLASKDIYGLVKRVKQLEKQLKKLEGQQQEQ